MNDRELAIMMLDRWFSSMVWDQILVDANRGDQDSIELMEQVSDQMSSLVWHLHNKSSPERIGYEIDWFNKLCDDFEVA